MSELIRDTTFGHLIRFVTRGRYLQFLEEKDPELWKTYVNQEKSGHLAHHGSISPPEQHSDDSDDKSAMEGLGGIRTRDARDKEMEASPDSHASSRSRIPEEGANYNHASGIKVDPEKGKDLHVIDFLENDPEVRILISLHSHALTLNMNAEPAQLVNWKEVLRHIPDMSFNYRNLYRLSDLYGRNRGYCPSL
jgi:hypothetical protein